MLTSSFLLQRTNAVDKRKRRKVRSFLRRARSLAIKHTWIIPLLLCAVVVTLYLINPVPSNPLSACLFPSYAVAQDADGRVQYGKGPRDFAFVAFYTAFFSFTRDFSMQRLIRPVAVALGIRSRAKQVRFMEQVYTAMYHGTLGFFGLYVMSKTPVWYFDTTAMFEAFPHRTHLAIFKAYYLLQASYWAQQMLVMVAGLEERRKDFKELVAHHIVTLALIWLSYRFHFTYMGLAVFITHDISDFFFACSKTLNYLDTPTPILGPFFGSFILIWIYLRHYINIRILVSLLPLPVPPLFAWLNSIVAHYTSPSLALLPTTPIFPNWTAQFASVGSYTLDWDTQQYKCWISQWITFGLLAALQSLNLFWLVLIARVAYRFATQNVAEDERSENGQSDIEEERFVSKEKVYKALNEEDRTPAGPLSREADGHLH